MKGRSRCKWGTQRGKVGPARVRSCLLSWAALSLTRHDLRFCCASREHLGPPESHIGTLHREVWLSLFELASVALGMPEESIAAAKEEDERVLGEEYVGLLSNVKVVFATKGDTLEVD